MSGRNRSLLLVALAVAIAGAPAAAEWIAAGREVPVERLVTNLTKYVAEHPDDAAAEGALARVLSMAWARGEEKVRVEYPEDEAGVPGFLPWQSVRERGSDRPYSEERGRLFKLSVDHYRKAVALAPDSALYELGLAYMLDDGSAFAREMGSPHPTYARSVIGPGTREKYEILVRQLGAEKDAERDAAAADLRRAFPEAFPVLLGAREDEDLRIGTAVGKLLAFYWQGFALAHYHRAYDLSVQADLKAESFCDEGDSSIAFEAGRAILRLSKGRDLDAVAAKKLAGVEISVSKLREKPRWITPIVFPVHGEASLASLVRSDRTVSFDLDGDGEPGRWPWVGPETGILVWDPAGTGRVRSGIDLFGSVTWWTFWRDGYEPLAALDDDGDGLLTGDELAGVAVWTDVSGDARSDPGEVVPAADAGIVAIAVRPTGRNGAVAAHRAGIEMADGTTRPTYDWTPKRR